MIMQVLLNSQDGEPEHEQKIWDYSIFSKTHKIHLIIKCVKKMVRVGHIWTNPYYTKSIG